jgi:hypothetical protein
MRPAYVGWVGGVTGYDRGTDEQTNKQTTSPTGVGTAMKFATFVIDFLA